MFTKIHGRSTAPAPAPTTRSTWCPSLDAGPGARRRRSSRSTPTSTSTATATQLAGRSAPVYRDNQMTVERHDLRLARRRRRLSCSTTARTSSRILRTERVQGRPTTSWRRVSPGSSSATSRVLHRQVRARAVRRGVLPRGRPDRAASCSRSASGSRAGKLLRSRGHDEGDDQRARSGVKVLTEHDRAEHAFVPPGVETWGFVEDARGVGSPGDVAMTISWPPYRPLGRRATAPSSEALSWVPKSQIAGKVGYALPPGGTPAARQRLRARRIVEPERRTRRRPICSSSG